MVLCCFSWQSKVAETESHLKQIQSKMVGISKEVMELEPRHQQAKAHKDDVKKTLRQVQVIQTNTEKNLKFLKYSFQHQLLKF